MNLNLLPLFVAVADSASFSVAAEQLGLRRSSVSRNVAALEKALAVQLFNRTTRQVSLTTAGKALYSKLTPQLEGLRDVLGALPEREEEASGLLRVSAPNDFGANVLPELIAAFSLRYPKVRLDVRLSNRFVDVVSEGFDVALRMANGRMRDSSLVAVKLSDLELQVFAAPTYLARVGTPRSVQDAAALDWVQLREKPVSPLLPARGSVLLGDDMLFVHGATRAGLGLSVLPKFLAHADVQAGRLVQLLPRVAMPLGAVYFVHAPGRLPRKLTAFRDFVVQYFKTEAKCS